MDDMDDRLKVTVEDEARRPTSQRERIALGASRRSREPDDRSVVNHDLSEADRLEMFRQELFNDALPNLPEIPGYHVCWLSTTHPSDTLHRRERLGYTPIKPEEAPGMLHVTLKTGDYAGMIGVNEMVAYKLPMSLYQAFMQEAHHDRPLKDARSIASKIDEYKDQAAREGAEIVEGDGMQELRRAPSRGIFRD